MNQIPPVKSQDSDTQQKIDAKEIFEDLEFFTKELKKQADKDYDQKLFYNTIVNFAAKLLGMLPQPLPWTKFIDKLNFSDKKKQESDKTTHETIFDNCLHQIIKIYSIISNEKHLDIKTKEFRKKIEDFEQQKEDREQLVQQLQKKDSFKQSKILAAAKEEINETEEQIKLLSTEVERITSQFTDLGKKVLGNVQSQLTWRCFQTEKSVEKVDKFLDKELLKEVATEAEEFFEINDCLVPVPKVKLIVQVKCFANLMVCQALISAESFLYVYELEGNLQTWIEKKTEKKFQCNEITAYTCVVQEQVTKNIYVALNNKKLQIYNSKDISQEPNKTIDLEVVCTDILSIENLLLLALKTNHIIVIDANKPDSNQTKIQINNPIHKLNLVKDFVIATEIRDVKSNRLRRIRSGEFTPLTLEQSRINCCDVFLEWNSQTNQCFGFDTKRQRFVQFQLEDIKPLNVYQKKFEIQINIKYVDFQQSFNFNRIYQKKAQNDQDNQLDPKTKPKYCPKEIYFQKGIQTKKVKVFILDLNTRLVNDDKDKQSKEQKPKIEEEKKQSNEKQELSDGKFIFEKIIKDENSYSETFKYKNKEKQIVTIQSSRQNQEVIRMQLMQIDEVEQEQNGQTEGINESNLTQNNLCLSQKEDYLFFIDQNKQLFVCETNKLQKLQWNAENDRKKDKLSERKNIENKDVEENKIQSQNEQAVMNKQGILVQGEIEKDDKKRLKEEKEAQEQNLRVVEQKRQEEAEIAPNEWQKSRMKAFQNPKAQEQVRNSVIQVPNQPAISNDQKSMASNMDNGKVDSQIVFENPDKKLQEQFKSIINSQANIQKQVEKAPLVSEFNEEVKDWTKVEPENKKKNKKKRN